MTKMELFTLRLPPEVVSEVEEVADKVHIPLRTLVRSWILQRLDEEKGRRSNND